MQIPLHRSRQREGINMTPMIDVVFLLIIFFLVSSHLSRQESRVELELPEASSAQKDTDLETPRVTINVLEDGSMWISGRPIEMNRLAETLEQSRIDQGDDIEVRIRGSREARYETFEPIMLACAQQSIWNVTFAVKQKANE